MAIQKNRFLLILFLVLGFSIVNSYAQTTLVVADMFEPYDNGSYPNANGWYNMFSGISSSVSSERSFWGIKSFKLEGSSNWSRVEAIDVIYDNVILYSVDVFIPNSSKGATVGFFKKEGNQASSYNAVMFRNDGTIYTRGTSESDKFLGNYASNTWYNVRVSINFNTNTMDVYIDGIMKAQGIVPKPKSYCTSFGISTNNFDGSGSAISYFDNVALLKINLQPNSPEALIVTEYYLYDFLIMIEAGFNPIVKKEIPSTMTQYKFVNIASYDACNATTRNYVENYVQNGGGVILMGGEPYIFGMSNIAHWFGASSYGNVFGYEVTASISASDPFNTGLSPGTLILDAKPNAYMNGGATVYNLANDSHVIARYNNNQVFAFYHEYQQGRVYYTAGASSPWYYYDEQVYKNWSILLAAAMQWVGRKEDIESAIIEPLVRDHSLHQEFYVDIQIKDAQNLFGVAFKFNFPADKLEALSAEKGDFMGTDLVFFPDINNSAGVVSVGISKKSGQPAANGAGIVARIKLKEKSSVTSGITIDLSLTEVAANDPLGNAITLTPQNTSYATPGASATLDVSPTSLTLGSAANSQGNFSVTSNVNWSVSKDVAWLTVSPANGSGNGTVTVTATSANTSANPRSATVTVSGSAISRTVSVTQSGIVQSGSYITLVVQNHSLRQEFYVDIQVNDVQNLFGVAFKFNFPADKLEALSAEKGDFLGTDQVFFPDINNSAGVVSVGVSKKSGQPAANGAGIVSRIKLKEKPSITSGIIIDLSLTEVTANDPDGNAITLTPQNTSYVTPDPTSVADRAEQLPGKYVLYPNYPNPFNPTTTINYALPELAHVKVQIFDVNGREVKRLVDQVCNAGVHSVVWNGNDEAQQKVSSGIYICRFSAGEVVLHRKLVLAK